MSEINSQEVLKKKLKIDSLEELKQEDAQRRFIELAKSQKISPELLKEVLSAIPELTAAFTAVIKSMRDVGVSLETTKQKRWEVLQIMAVSGKFSPDHILEAIKIIAEIEKNESIDWNKIFDKALDVLKVVGTAVSAATLLAVIIILSGGKIVKRE